MRSRRTPLAVAAACALAAAIGLVVPAPGAAPSSGEIVVTDAASTTASTATAKKAYEIYRHDHTTTPMPWLACKPIGFRINTAHMPKGMDTVTKTVMAAIGKQIGVTFSYLGTTTRQFGSKSHSKTVPTIYIAFTASKQAGGTTFGWPGTIGVGGPGAGWLSSSSKGEFDAILYGDVLLYTGFKAPQTGAGVTWSSLLRHEVGHALDLAHRTSKTEVMYPTLTAQAPAQFQAAEVTAIKKVVQKSKCDYTSFAEMP